MPSIKGQHWTDSEQVALILRECLEEGSSIEINGLGVFRPGRRGGFVFESRRTRRVFIAYAVEDAPTALVRRDANFTRLGLCDADVQSAEQVAEVLAAHPEMIQRPVLVADGAAIIGRPKDRIAPFLAAHS